MSATLSRSVFDFLTDLAAHNERDWFNAHEDRYQAALAEVKAFADALLERMSQHDHIEKLQLHRIYRDTRFSKDKTPYKQHFSGGMSRATKWLRGGYYFHLEPDNVFVGGGFWGPEPHDLKRIREELAAEPDRLRKILAEPLFQKTFGELQGEQLKTAPQGYSQDHPAIDLLRYKQFLIARKFSMREALAASFLDEMVETFHRMRPFFDYMSEVLTTDSNGVPLGD